MPPAFHPPEASRAQSPGRLSRSTPVVLRHPAQATSQAPPPSSTAHCACGGSCPHCGEASPSLAISDPSDSSEREADQVAHAVMAADGTPGISRLASGIQRFSGDVGGQSIVAPESVNQTLAGPGRPLEPALRRYMEPRFDYDFSQVRVHLGNQAERSAREIDADAYAVGRDLVFGAGKYAPATSAGKHLIAHELTHVVQQTGAGPHRRLARYRSKGKDTIAFDAANETLTDAKKQPWVESIGIHFDKAAVDDGHKAAASAAGQLEPRMPTGTLTAKYSAKSSTVPADIVLPIAGGSTMLGVGLTDRVKAAKVTRLEGLGYTDSENIRLGNLTDPVAKSGKGARYSKSGAGTMNYAIFFKGIQAVHQGLLNTGSHACVHVGNGTSMRELNYHTRIGVTTVTVSYDSSVLADLCCHRKKTGNTSWNTNPCDSTKCP
ncbi:hypothetical protein D3C85_885710 [compost metagenome]